MRTVADLRLGKSATWSENLNKRIVIPHSLQRSHNMFKPDMEMGNVPGMTENVYVNVCFNRK